MSESGSWEPDQLGERILLSVDVGGGIGTKSVVYEAVSNQVTETGEIAPGVPTVLNSIFPQTDPVKIFLRAKDPIVETSPVQIEIPGSVTWHVPVGGGCFALGMRGIKDKGFLNNFESTFYKDLTMEEADFFMKGGSFYTDGNINLSGGEIIKSFTSPLLYKITKKAQLNTVVRNSNGLEILEKLNASGKKGFLAVKSVENDYYFWFGICFYERDKKPTELSGNPMLWDIISENIYPGDRDEWGTVYFNNMSDGTTIENLDYWFMPFD
jgi:hypothetical protein